MEAAPPDPSKVRLSSVEPSGTVGADWPQFACSKAIKTARMMKERMFDLKYLGFVVVCFEEGMLYTLGEQHIAKVRRSVVSRPSGELAPTHEVLGLRGSSARQLSLSYLLAYQKFKAWQDSTVARIVPKIEGGSKSNEMQSLGERSKSE